MRKLCERKLCERKLELRRRDVEAEATASLPLGSPLKVAERSNGSPETPSPDFVRVHESDIEPVSEREEMEDALLAHQRERERLTDTSFAGPLRDERAEKEESDERPRERRGLGDGLLHDGRGESPPPERPRLSLWPGLGAAHV